jgi:hypothetical protein
VSLKLKTHLTSEDEGECQFTMLHPNAPSKLASCLWVEWACHAVRQTSLTGGERTIWTQALNELLESDSKYGFIVMDGNGSLYGTLSGNAREILHKFSVDLPKKHGRGGQSALRFARLRLEKRHNYVRKVRVGTLHLL